MLCCCLIDISALAKSMTKLMPGLAGGDVLGGACGETGRVRGDTDSAQIEAVGVEADGEGGLGLGWAAVVDFAGGDEERHAGIIQVKMAGLAECQGELCAARAVLRVPAFVFPAGIVEEGEEADDLLIGRVDLGEVESVATDRAPVGWAVFRAGAETELGDDELPEPNFGGHEIGGHVFRERAFGHDQCVFSSIPAKMDFGNWDNATEHRIVS